MADEDVPEVPKHLGLEGRRKRFDPGTKWGGHSGKTLVKGRTAAQAVVDGVTDVFLKVSRPTDEDGNVLVSKLDIDFPDILGPFPKCLEELKGGRLFELETLLEGECISKHVISASKRLGHTTSSSKIVVTTYTVAGVEYLAPGEEERRLLEQKREARLSLARAVPDAPEYSRWKVWCKFRDSPLESITDPTLLDHRSKLSASSGDHNSANARVFEEHSRSCFCPPAATCSEHYLQVDLGADCKVSVISTQGRFPEIARVDKPSGMRIVREGTPASDNWVTRYEVSYRANAGKEWVSLGEFKGNSDCLTEVAHWLTPEGREKEAPTFRYLRFKPLTFNKQPAMRVGVYGQRPGEASEKRDASEALGDDRVVKYEFRRVRAETNLRRTPYGNLGAFCCARKSCRHLMLPEVGTRRKRIKEGVVEEVRKLVDSSGAAGDIGGLLLEEEDEEEGPATEEGGAAAPAAPAAFRPPPRLLRQRSRSESDLSSSAAAAVETSSAGDSYVQVSAATGGDDDEDAWVVLPS